MRILLEYFHAIPSKSAKVLGMQHMCNYKTRQTCKGTNPLEVNVDTWYETYVKYKSRWIGSPHQLGCHTSNLIKHPQIHGKSHEVFDNGDDDNDEGGWH